MVERILNAFGMLITGLLNCCPDRYGMK